MQYVEFVVESISTFYGLRACIVRLVKRAALRLLRAAAAPRDDADRAGSFRRASATYREYVMPELLLVLCKDLREAPEPERHRRGLPGAMVPHVLSFLEHDAFAWGSGRRFCGLCGVSAAAAKLTRCKGCKRVWYCSAEHQNAAWKAHKKVCDARGKKKKKAKKKAATQAEGSATGKE